MYPKILKAFYVQLEKKFRDAELIAGKSGRHMKFPYTLSAKIAQFPVFYYMQNNPIWMYYPFGLITASYFMLQIHNTVNSDANVRAWAETQRKAAEKEHH